MPQCGGTVRLRGGGLGGAQLARRRLVPDGPLRKGTVQERLPADVPKLRALCNIVLLQNRACVVPDLISVTDPQPRGAGRRDNVLAVGTPGEKRGVWSLRRGHLQESRQ